MEAALISKGCLSYVEHQPVAGRVKHPVDGDSQLHHCPEGGYQPEEKMSVYDAVCMFTKNLHYAAGQDAVLGTLEPGKFADMVVIDRDIFKIPADEIMDIQVEKTYLAGREVYSK